MRKAYASIFVRLYGGLLACILIVAGGAWFSLDQVNDWRAERYRERMATGIFRLIALGVARQEESERKAWLDNLSRIMEVPFSIVPADKEYFSVREWEKLARGRAIVRLYEAQNYADIYSRIPGRRELYVKTRMMRVSEQQAKVMALLFVEELASVPLEKRAQKLKELRPFFGFPVRDVAADKVALDREQRQRLERNEVVLVLKEGNSPASSSIRIVAPLPEKGRALELGPMYLFDWMPVQLTLLAAIAALLMITLAAYLLIHPLEKRIKSLEQTVRKVRAGDLGARTAVEGRDEIGQLAGAFNNMAEHIQRLISSQREMVRAVSHELRTPVARLRFGMEMLADTDDSGSRQDQLKGLDEDIEQLNQLIDEILTYAKLEEGTPQLDLAQFDLVALLQRVKNETEALGTPIRISITLSDRRPVMAEGELRYVHRVLQNLVGNAIRYARSEVFLSCGTESGRVFVCVDDDGPGIPEADRERIFKPFARLDDSRTRASGGYGLGLSIVQRIAFWHEGKVQVGASKALGGARFVFSWPRHLTRATRPELTKQ